LASLRRPVAHRAGRRQVAVWLAEDEWSALDAIVRRAGLSRAGAFAVLLEEMGRTSLAEAVLSDAPGRYRQGWALPLRDGMAPRTRFGRVRLATWLSPSLAAKVNEAFRQERRKRGLRVLSFPSLAEAHSSSIDDPDQIGRVSP
jgi:hypothetical protein